MGKNLLLLAATLLLFSMVSCGLGWHAAQGGAGTLPGDAAMWRTVALVLLVVALLASVGGMLLSLFGQVRRRHEEQRNRERRFGPRGQR